MDFLAELGLAPLPTSPTAEGGSAPRKTPAGSDAGNFAAHMQNMPRARLLDQAQAERSSGQSLIVGEQRATLEPGELATAEHQTAAPAEQIVSSGAGAGHPAGARAVLDAGGSVVPAPPTPDARTIEPNPASPHRRRAHGPDGGSAPALAAQMTAAITEPAAASGPEAAVLAEGTTKGPAEAESGRAQRAVQETEPGSAPSVFESSPDCGLASPPAAAQMADAGPQEPVHAFPPERQIMATSASTDDEKGAPPAARLSRADLAPASLQLLRQALESEAASDGSYGVSPPPVPGAGLTDSSEPARPQTQEVTGAIEPRIAFGLRYGANGGRELPVQVKFAAQEAQASAQPRAAGDSAVQQPDNDSQFGRLPNLSGAHGATLSMPHAAIGPAGELAQSFARGLDGAVTLEHGPDPAAKQVALQITRALDQDRTEIRIRLDPPELGDVDIHLEFRDLRLTATFSAERSDTLDLLQRDARTLARALREAGIELADSDLSFAYNGRNDRPDPGPHAQRMIALPHALSNLSRVQDRPLALGKPDGFVSLSDGRMDLRA